MLQRLHFLICLILLFSFSSATYSQNVNSDENVQVHLSLKNGKIVYRIGEPIRLILTFTAKTGTYNVLVSSEKLANSPDEIVLSPKEGAFAWLEQYQRGKYYMNDYFGYTKLSEAPVNTNLALNDFFRFDTPGKYSVYIKTKRVSTPKDKYQIFGQPVSLVSNTVEFEVKEMSDAEEREEIKRLNELINSKRDWREQDEFVRDLSFLTGDAATIEKVNRFLTPSGEYRGNYYYYIREGLLSARNKSLAIKLLEDALRDPNREVNQDLPYMLAELRWLQENGDSKSNTETDARKLIQIRNTRISEIRQEYLNEIQKNLSKRRDKNRLVTAYTIFTQLPQDDSSSEAFKTTKAILLENFDDLTPFGKDTLLNAFWDKIKTPALIPSIEKILVEGKWSQYPIFRSNALKRLIELDEKRARPFVVSDILEPNSLTNVEILGMLTDSYLPEVDVSLLERIRVRGEMNSEPYLRHSTELAARFASPAIYDKLMGVYKTFGAKWSPDARATLLAYFARHNEKEVLPLVEQELTGLEEFRISSFLAAFTKAYYSEGINEFLKKRLANDDPDIASSVPWLMAKYGPASNEQVFRDRLARWRKEWSNRIAEIDDANSERKIKTQAKVEGELISALLRAKSWKLSDAEINELKQSCLTEWCRQLFPKPLENPIR